MKTTKLEWMKFYVSRFMNSEDVETMTAEEVGQYMLLLCTAWAGNKKCSLPDDAEYLDRKARGKLSPRVRSKFVTTAEGRLVNETQLEIWEEQNSLYTVASESGKRGRAKQLSDDAQATSGGAPDHPQGTSGLVGKGEYGNGSENENGNARMKKVEEKKNEIGNAMQNAEPHTSNSILIPVVTTSLTDLHSQSHSHSKDNANPQAGPVDCGDSISPVPLKTINQTPRPPRRPFAYRTANGECSLHGGEDTWEPLSCDVCSDLDILSLNVIPYKAAATASVEVEPTVDKDKKASALRLAKQLCDVLPAANQAEAPKKWQTLWAEDFVGLLNNYREDEIADVIKDLPHTRMKKYVVRGEKCVEYFEEIMAGVQKYRKAVASGRIKKTARS